MTRLNVVIRGHIYEPNWTPVSIAHESYDIDFLKVATGYVHLLEALRAKYDLQTYVSTYEGTSLTHLEFVKALPSYVATMLSPREHSDQFTTVLRAIDTLLPELTLFIRGDLIMTPHLINTICAQDAEAMNAKCHVLSLEHLPYAGLDVGENCIDILQVVPAHLLVNFREYICKIDREHNKQYEQILHRLPEDFHFPCNHAHDFHKYVECDTLSSDPACESTYTCDLFFKIFRGTN